MASLVDRKNFDRLSGSYLNDAADSLAYVLADWWENAEGHVFKVDIPGVTKDQVKVEVQLGRFLEISGKLRRKKDEQKEKWHRVERSSGRYVRRFKLPENAKTEETKASMKDGVLTVTIPRREIKEAPIISTIKISDE